MKFRLSVSTSFCISGFYIFAIGLLWLISLSSCRDAGTCGVQQIAGFASFSVVAIVPFLVVCRLFYLAHYRKQPGTELAISAGIACVGMVLLAVYQFISDPGDAIWFATPVLVNAVALACAVWSFPKSELR